MISFYPSRKAGEGVIHWDTITLSFQIKSAPGLLLLSNDSLFVEYIASKNLGAQFSHS